VKIAVKNVVSALKPDAAPKPSVASKAAKVSKTSTSSKHVVMPKTYHYEACCYAKGLCYEG
jgi:hypothetical protein